MDETRPALTAVRSGAELRRWYWLRAELQDLAGALGLSRSGGKEELLQRLSAALDGEPVPAPARRRPAARQLTAPVGPRTVIPDGQRCSQVLRHFFTAEVGPAFRFDEHMREFIAQGEGRTLAEAVEHWHRTREVQTGKIGRQFEYNGFTRAWFAAHPGGTQPQCLEAWQRYRALPVDARDREAGPGVP
ncbi:SAP domain-containing protein [Georgenia satyanarayanai]|uniref:DUF6434 domain-containing protein n=1 Tax=Georgenia satyanarayanai TaxID=860221 RepID=UPI00203CA405|nr:DUF6434 domain-containing protein [Georgenia satyanarayanai]MCM3660714.1 SAP domain-containing protein [Georgenia satyanarayanai]